MIHSQPYSGQWLHGPAMNRHGCLSVLEEGKTLIGRDHDNGEWQAPRPVARRSPLTIARGAGIDHGLARVHIAYSVVVHAAGKSTPSCATPFLAHP